MTPPIHDGTASRFGEPEPRAWSWRAGARVGYWIVLCALGIPLAVRAFVHVIGRAAT